MRRIILCLLATLAIAATPPPSGALLITPHFTTAPATWRLRVTIEPHTDNRAACVTMDGPMFRQSCWTLEPDSPRTTWIELKDFPAGSYTGTLQIERKGGKSVVFRDTACAVGAGEGSEEC